MNGEIPSVPITTLAGIASLTDLLPELPVAGPSNIGGPGCPSSNYLYHHTITEEANMLLSQPNDALASQLGIALAQTPVDHVMLNQKNMSAFTHQNPPPMAANTSHLQGALYRRDQTLFQSMNRQQQLEVQSQWRNGANVQQQQSTSNMEANYSPGHNYSHNSPASNAAAASGGYMQQQQYGYNQQQQYGYQQSANSAQQQQQQQSHHPPQQSHPQQQHVPQQQHSSLSHGQQHSNAVQSQHNNASASQPQNNQPVQPKYNSTNGDMMNVNQQQSHQSHHAVQQQHQPVQQQQQQQHADQQKPIMISLTKKEPSVPPKQETPSATTNHIDGGVKEEKKNNALKPMLKLSKLSKEDEELMQKSLKAFAKENPQRAQDLGVTGGRSRRAAKIEYSDGSDSDSDETDNGEPKKLKSKFFRATEKDREEEKRRMKEERRKRRAEEGADDSGVVGKRRRKDDASPFPGDQDEELKPFVPIKKTKKVARSLIPMINRVDDNDAVGTFFRFKKAVDVIFENMDEVNLQELEAASNAADGDIELPPEVLIPKYQLQELAYETAKLKSMGAMDGTGVDTLVKLLTVLELNIRDGAKIIPIISDDDEDDEKNNDIWLEMAMERVMRAAEASVTVLNIMTSKKMSKRVYIDDVIDRVALFLRFQLSNTIYPSFDPVYREISKSKTGYVGSMKKKRTHAHAVRDKNILHLYNRVTEMVTMLAELVRIQLLTDTSILHISTLGVAPFFVEAIPELQLAALKLVTNVFSKYDKHRKLLLDDILASIARLPSSKRSLRTYRLGPDTHIQMLTALVLQLIQCVVTLPKKLALKGEKILPTSRDNEEDDGDDSSEVDRDVLIDKKFQEAMATAVTFVEVFLKKCGSKNEDIDYRPLFENFVQDLLTTVNTPDWPAAELLLSLLGVVLRKQFINRSSEMALRLSSLEYLGVIAARLRKDFVQSKLRIDYIDSIVSAIREEEEKDQPDHEDQEEESEKSDGSKKKKKNKKKTEAVTDEDKEKERTLFLQRVLLDFLAVNSGEVDQAMMNARHFYIGQWYRDAKSLGKPPKRHRKNKVQKKKRYPDDSSEEDSGSDDEGPSEDDLSESAKAELYRLREERKDFLVKKILPFGVSRGNKAQVLSTHIDMDSAALITRYLSSKRPFFNSFDSYLKDILGVLTEQSTQIRTKALKCMTMIVTEDPEVLLRNNMQNAVQYSLNDSSTMVREAAVDLVGRFILHKQDLVTQYYKIITDRILDTGVSVRKRVIKILKDICLEFPSYNKIPEMCVKMIRRIEDEEGIRKLVMDVFQNMWFVPLPRHPSPDDQDSLITKARNITDVVVACRTTGLEWFEQLLETLFRPKEDKDDATKKNTEANPQLVLACQQLVDCLVESVLRMEESNSDHLSPAANENGGQNNQRGASNRLVACLTTLFIFAKTRPQLLVPHVQTLTPYLTTSGRSQADFEIVASVARTMELTVPLLKHPSEIFLSQLEEASIKLIFNSGIKVVKSCISCLGSVVNEVTKNFKLIRDCFKQYYGWMAKFREVHGADPNDRRLAESLPKFRRSMFVVGLLIRHFDFSKEEIYEGLIHGDKTVEEVFRTMFYFMRHHKREVQLDALAAIGSVCVRHHKFMMESKLKTLYIDIMTQSFYPTEHKVKVLSNVESFLVEEEARMIRQDKHWKEYQEKENLKEMGDVSSGMASTVIQVYLKAILDSFLHAKAECRLAAVKVIGIILSQGLVNPAQIVAYLICMATDETTQISHAADRDLKDIEKKYPGFIHMKLLQGIRLSFRLQQIIQNDPVVVRGYRVVKEGDLPSAMNGYLYSILKNTKSQRRGILMSLLKQFDESSKNSLSMMLYLADNLAYIPYTVLDEPLFVIHHIDIQISVSGSNLLQTFKEGLKPPPSCEQRFNLETGKTEYIYDEDLDDDEESVFTRLPDDLRPLQVAITAAQGCNLLLVLKEHLKNFYGLTAAKLSQYSPNDTSKAFDRQVNRRNNVKFNPRQTIEILKLGEPPAQLNDKQKLDLVKKYMEFKELMNKIDPDEEEDEDGNPIPQSEKKPTLGSYRARAQAAQQQHQQLAQQYNNNQIVNMNEPGRSYHQPHQQAWQQYQQQQQQQQSRQQPLRQSSRETPKKVKSYNEDSYYSGSTEGMVLDPLTGDFVPAGGGGCGEDDDDDGDVQVLNNEKPVVIKLGQLASKHSSENSTQGSHRVPKLTINLGRPIDGSNGGVSSSKKHHKKHKHKKKKKRHIDSDEDDDDVVELSNDSDADYRV